MLWRVPYSRVKMCAKAVINSTVTGLPLNKSAPCLLYLKPLRQNLKKLTRGPGSRSLS